MKATAGARARLRAARAAALAAAIASAPLGAPASAGPRDPLYRWTDADGAVRYTTEIERIPEERRAEAVEVRAQAATPPAARAAAPPGAAPPSPAPTADRAASAPPVDAPPPEPAAPEEIAAIDARIAELERAIAADEAAVGDYISNPERDASEPRAGEVAAIAERLPRLHAELRELRRQREAAIAGDGD